MILNTPICLNTHPYVALNFLYLSKNIVFGNKFTDTIAPIIRGLNLISDFIIKSFINTL